MVYERNKSECGTSGCPFVSKDGVLWGRIFNCRQLVDLFGEKNYNYDIHKKISVLKKMTSIQFMIFQQTQNQRRLDCYSYGAHVSLKIIPLIVDLLVNIFCW